MDASKKKVAMPFISSPVQNKMECLIQNIIPKVGVTVA